MMILVAKKLSIVLGQWFSIGGPWPISGQRTSVYFENGFACRIRLKNTGSYEQPYRPAPVNYKRNEIFIWRSTLLP